MTLVTVKMEFRHFELIQKKKPASKKIGFSTVLKALNVCFLKL